MELIDIMKGIELFRGLDQAQLRRVAGISERHVYEPGEAIVSMDSPGDSMFIITEGQVAVYTSPSEDVRHTAVYLGEGQVFGEMALLDGGPRSATVSSIQEGTVVYSIPRDVFLRLCAEDTALGYLLMRNLALELSFKLRHANLENE